MALIDLTLRCPTCGKRADMCFAHGENWKKRGPDPPLALKAQVQMLAPKDASRSPNRGQD